MKIFRWVPIASLRYSRRDRQGTNERESAINLLSSPPLQTVQVAHHL
ncbi:MAG: hypothetical protein SAK29_24245 [Scytonema sp. PMC 1069.18]|nr:hypothetical protein [Scytonema sp. PMC 1069.18]